MWTSNDIEWLASVWCFPLPRASDPFPPFSLSQAEEGNLSLYSDSFFPYRSFHSALKVHQSLLPLNKYGVGVLIFLSETFYDADFHSQNRCVVLLFFLLCWEKKERGGEGLSGLWAKTNFNCLADINITCFLNNQTFSSKFIDPSSNFHKRLYRASFVNAGSTCQTSVNEYHKISSHVKICLMISVLTHGAVKGRSCKQSSKEPWAI